MLEFSRRDMLKVTAVATAGSLITLAGAENATAATHPILKTGSAGPEVLALQRRLTSLTYWLGTPDGYFGDLTRQAVIAIQKVAALPRSGICEPATWLRVDAGLKSRARSTKGHVVEIGKSAQTLLVVDSGVVKQTYSTSTGSNKPFTTGGKWYIAVTPSGSFRVFRRVNRWDKGPLGSLYRPQYFNGGIAVHGAGQVPPWPASHGCARVSVPAMDHLWGVGGIQLGTPVLVY